MCKTQHLLPHFDLLEDSNKMTKDSEQNITEEHFNDNDTLLVPYNVRTYILSDNENKADVRRKDTEKEESNIQKKNKLSFFIAIFILHYQLLINIYFFLLEIESTLCNMQLTQNRMFMMIQ